MTVRKKILLSQEIANHLEELAMRNNTTQTDIIKEMIEERGYQELSKQQKLRHLKPLFLCHQAHYVKKISNLSRQIEMYKRVFLDANVIIDCLMLQE